jgi:hypothetical protein
MFGLLTAMFAEQEIISFDIVDRGLDRQTGQFEQTIIHQHVHFTT